MIGQPTPATQKANEPVSNTIAPPWPGASIRACRPTKAIVTHTGPARTSTKTTSDNTSDARTATASRQANPKARPVSMRVCRRVLRSSRCDPRCQLRRQTSAIGSVTPLATGQSVSRRWTLSPDLQPMSDAQRTRDKHLILGQATPTRKPSDNASASARHGNGIGGNSATHGLSPTRLNCRSVISGRPPGKWSCPRSVLSGFKVPKNSVPEPLQPGHISISLTRKLTFG